MIILNKTQFLILKYFCSNFDERLESWNEYFVGILYLNNQQQLMLQIGWYSTINQFKNSQFQFERRLTLGKNNQRGEMHLLTHEEKVIF